MTVLFKFMSSQNIFNSLDFFTEYDSEGYPIEENYDEDLCDGDLDDGFETESDDYVDSIPDEK